MTTSIPSAALVLFLSAAAATATTVAAPGRVPQADEAVVVLHGLARGSKTMAPLAHAVGAAGYRVANLDYPSTEANLGELASYLADQVESCCASARRLHFVAYSLGSIITRAYLAENRPINLGRVVMIAPPNRGSEIVDLLGGLRLFRLLFGPTAIALRTDDSGLTQALPAIDYEVGIIAGDRPVNPFGAMVIPGADDGGVSVEGAKLYGMTDFITVHRSHTFIVGAPEVARQTLHFLREGAFEVK